VTAADGSGWLPGAMAWLGDSRLIVPLLLLTALAGWRRSRQPSLWLCTATLLCAALVGASKLAYLFAGISIPRIAFYGLSGHAAMAALCWPLWAFAVAGAQRRRAWVAAAAGGVLALVTGISRITLDLHSWSEVIAGWSLGASLAALLMWRWRRQLQLPATAAMACAVTAVLLAACLPRGATVELGLQRLASWAQDQPGLRTGQ
jgi:hypothetical protein